MRPPVIPPLSVSEALVREDTRRIRVIIADEQPIFREGLKLVLDKRGYNVVAEASETAEALGLAESLQPEVLLLDVSMAHEDAFASLAKVAPAVRTIVLLARSDPHAAVVALQWGARGVLPKECRPDVLFESIECVLRDKYWLPGSDASEMVDVIRRLAARAESEANKMRRYGLTPRDLEVVSGVVAGESNRDIARRLSVREDTVKHRLSKVFDKLGVFSRVELAVFAIHHGLAPDDGGDMPSGSVVN